MDIDLLSKMVKELILDNDRVVLPGLGYFAAEIVPSSFSDRGFTINPPYRRLYFRQSGDRDGLLARLYAESNGTGTDVAEHFIEDFVRGMQEILDRDKVIVLPGLGRLRATKENNYFFVPDEDMDIYPEGTGLEPVSLKNHGVAAVVPEEIPVPEPVGFPESDTVRDATDSAAEPAAELETAEGPAEAPGIEPAAEEPAAIHEEETTEDTPEEGTEILQGGTPEMAREEAPEETTAAAVNGKPEAEPRKGMPAALKIILISIGAIIALAVIALVVFVVLAHTAPDFIDSLLYTPEELEILKY